MTVYFKFKSAKDPDFVSFDGSSISVANLKEKIVDKKKLRNGTDHDLVLSNAQTNEDYTDEDFLVPKNTSVLVRRVPRPTVPLVVEEKSPDEFAPVRKLEVCLKSAEIGRLAADDEFDDFGTDLYARAEVIQAPVPTLLKENEDDKIKALVKNSALEWDREVQESVTGAKGYINNGRGRNQSLRGEQGREFQKQTPPPGYVCHRCRVAGHLIQHCPTNGDPDYDVKKVRPPTGIPKTMLVPDSDGTYFLPTGQVAVLEPNEVVFEREVECLPSLGHKIVNAPLELRCPLCKDVLKDAVLTSRCCFKSYCDKCIRNQIISKRECACGATNVLADDLLPNRTLRDAIHKLLEAQVSSFSSSGNVSTITSSGNAGSRVQVPDTQSAHKRPRFNSPAVSIGLKEASNSQGHPQLQSSSRSKLVIRFGASDRVEQGAEVAEDSAESQLKEPTEEAVSSERLVALDAEVKGQGHTQVEPVKAKKKRKVKRAHPESSWSQEPNYSNFPAEDCCMHCGSYEHLSRNCYMLCYPGQFYQQTPVQGPTFMPGFNPKMVGMMHPQGEGYRVPYHHNSGPYGGYEPAPYDSRFNGPIPQQRFFPHQRGMMS